MRSFRCPSNVAQLGARLVALLALGACTEFESIDRDECGNGILEFGEDCDSSDERCVACSVTCDGLMADCESYGDGMEGFVCGADGLCHAPAGAFLPLSDHALPVDSYRITDIDKDGIGDVLVQSATSVDVLYGKSDGPPSARVSLQSPIARGPACYGDRDGDSALDLVLPTSDGIVTYTSELGALVPLPFASPIDPNMGAPLLVRALSDDILVLVGTRQDSLRLAVLDVRVEPQQVLLDTSFCNALPGEVDARQIDVAETPAGFVIAASIDGGTGRRLCAMRVERSGLSWVPANISPPIVPVSRPLLYSATGGCPSLFVTDADHLVEVAPTGPPCAFGSRRDFVSTNAGSVPLAAFPFERPDLGKTTVGLVLLGGVFHIDGGVLQPLFSHDRLLTTAAATDLDNDGLTDLVASTADNEDLEIYYRLPGIQTLAFRRYRYSTDGAIRSFVFGDFDGNQRTDIAYVQAGTGSSTSEQLAIAYGTSDLLLHGAVVGSFGTVHTLIPTDIADSNDPGSGVVDDLVVLFTADPRGEAVSNEVNLVLLHGSPQRTMLSFFSPRSDDQGQFRGAVAGHFLDTAAGDLLAFEEIVNTKGSGKLVRMWQTSTLASGDRIPYTIAPQLNDCETDKAAQFCVDGARYIAWPDRPGELDIVIGVDRLGRAIALDPRQLNANPEAEDVMTVAQVWPAGLLGDAEGPVRSMHAFTVDGTSRLVVSRDTGNGTVSVCTLDATGMASSCSDLATEISTVIGIDNIACRDATPARVAPTSRFAPPSTSTDLVVLCYSIDVVDPGAPDEPPTMGGGISGVFRVSFAGDTIAADPLLFLAGEQVRVGDVDGDGLDDLIVLDRTTGVSTLQIYTQCSSRDVGCLRQGPIVDEPVAGGAR